MVVLDADGVRVALFVDALVGQHQVVIKSLEANYRKVNGVAGATIMGDGRVAPDSRRDGDSQHGAQRKSRKAGWAARMRSRQ